jgi:hypothetical protein
MLVVTLVRLLEWIWRFSKFFLVHLHVISVITSSASEYFLPLAARGRRKKRAGRVWRDLLDFFAGRVYVWTRPVDGAHSTAADARSGAEN